jgi:hypothetical protein
MNDDEQLKQALVQPNRKAKTMTKTKRFVVTGDRNIIDTLNLAKSPNGYCHQCDPKTIFTFAKGYSRQDWAILSVI